MTMKPKARKFRIRRSDDVAPTGETRAAEAIEAREAAAGAQAAARAPIVEEDTSLPNVSEDGFGDMALPGSAAADRAQASASAAASAAPSAARAGAGRGGSEASVEAELAAIRSEGLTGRQLRMARRAAQKHGLSPSSDFDAVRQLRKRGLDPFGNSNMLELVVNENKGAGVGAGAGVAPAGAAGGNTLPVRAATAQVPATQAAAPPPPAGVAHTAESRAAEIMNVQRDIANRRRRKLIQLATRLALFVFLPTILVSYYYYAVATPLYATNTEFVIQKAEASAGGSGLGGLLGGSSFATVQESITVQSYLESREAMLRLDEELGFREHFSGENVDPLVRLAPDASDEQMYGTYSRNLTIGYDPVEGIVRMEILATDAATSQAFSEALISYAEERVDQMSSRLREDQMAGAREGFEEAEERSLAAQMRVLALQEQRGVLSAEAEVSQVFNQIGTYEMQLTEQRLRLAEMQASPRPNATRVQVAEETIARYEDLIAQLRASLTDEAEGEVSLARIQSELVIAQADLETRQLMLTEALQAMESARVEANRQTLYISMGVFPVAPDEAAYPKAFEKTLLALVVFSGIYLLISMTASILREQVSS